MEDRGRTITAAEAIAEARRLDLTRGLALLRLVLAARHAEGDAPGARRIEDEIAHMPRPA